ncbi:MAG: hypothetical protein MUC51_15650 [Anaerolineae bacterium]|jgi:hypothetical protein|nr:hypothetical protein [Anaerolineae bacterium]
MPKRKRRIIISYKLTVPDLQIQPSLLQVMDPIIETPKKDLSIEERFRLFDQANPQVYQVLEQMALDLAARGHERIGVKMLWETLRYRYAMQTNGEEDYRLDNNYTSRFARKLAQNPMLAERIEMRQLKAE